MRTKVDIFVELVSDIDRNLPIWPTTMGHCMNEGDGQKHERYARGGGRCLKCIEREMKGLFNPGFGKTYVEILIDNKKDTHSLICDMMDILREERDHS